ncbi:Outer membrane protein assembly factor BamD [Anatilimnocola aggregata]|uniref:Outer membrane protein assembly factor BamD n=1 Tax=Anatilimnocola aggregata TaxID=2528021 RepID=A0A517Y4W0_9BACT|nr:outer membrane protein assembly factor BamD [Anatilimnocola aggregata]QDU25236.1 Outer membrane protein assembly factor BamD [Anatilimnocola aggregata]
MPKTAASSAPTILRATMCEALSPAVGRCAWTILGIALLTLCLGCQSLVPRSKSPSEVTQANNMFDSADDSPEQVAADAASDAALEALTWDDFQPKNLTRAVKKVTGNGPNRKVARELYREAEGIYREAAAKPENQRQELFVAAAEKYAEAADRWPGSALQQDALFMSGESYYFADYYPKANDQYEQVIKAFPNNRYLDTIDQRRFAVARYWLDKNRKEPESWYAFNLFDQERPWRDTRGYALRVFDKIRVDDPTGRLADDATLAAGNENFASGRFQKADDYYSDLRQAYPTSEHQFNAHYLGLKAKLMSYMGPDYGAGALDEAEKLIKQIKRQFPKEYAAEQDYLDRASAEIRYKKAEKVYKLAEYFDFRAEYRAAGQYYQRIVREFDDTPFAEKAANRIAEISDKPGKPEQYVPWLVDLFPKRDKISRVQDAVDAYEKANPTPEAQSPVQQAGFQQ